MLQAAVRTWVDEPSTATQGQILLRLDEWQQACERQQDLEVLCQVYLLRARVALATFQLDEVEQTLTHCLDIARDAGMTLYQDTARQALEGFQQHKQHLKDLVGKPLSPQEQAEELQSYIRRVLAFLEEEGIEREQ